MLHLLVTRISSSQMFMTAMPLLQLPFQNGDFYKNNLKNKNLIALFLSVFIFYKLGSMDLRITTDRIIDASFGYFNANYKCFTWIYFLRKIK